MGWLLESPWLAVASALISSVLESVRLAAMIQNAQNSLGAQNLLTYLLLSCKTGLSQYQPVNDGSMPGLYKSL
jgi:hypothetical protein